MFTIAFIISLITLVISVPIFLVFGLGSSIAAVGGLNLPWSVLIQVSFGALTKHVLIAVPLFIFAGIVTTGILIIGYTFNAFSHFFI